MHEWIIFRDRIQLEVLHYDASEQWQQGRLLLLQLQRRDAGDEPLYL
jgi:hypothetical protein